MAAEHDPLDDDANQAVRQDAQDKRELRDSVDDADLRWILASKKGRRFIFNLLDHGGTLRSSFNTNALTMAFQEGRRFESAALTERIFRLSPESYLTMIKEQNDE